MDSGKLKRTQFGEYTLKELSAADMVACLEGENLNQAELLVRCICDGDGNRVYQSADDIPARVAIRALPLILSLSELDAETLDVQQKKTISAV